MATKLYCDLCGKQILRSEQDNYTYDIVLKKRNGAVYGEAYIDICAGCLEKSGMDKKIVKC
jgi:hypothetical protein